MNKAITIGLAGLLLFLGIQYGNQDNVWDEQEIADFISFNGTITEVREDSILVQDNTNEDNSMILNTIEEVLLLADATKNSLEASSLEVGQEITAYYPENAPMALKMPPVMTPDVIVVNSGEDAGFVHVATFDETLTSADDKLKITLGSGMTLVDRDGNPVTSLTNKTLVVFYSSSTRSIPAQTTPEKIIVL